MKIPFYGKRGSIAEIEENDDEYKILSYNIDGKVDKDSEKIIRKNFKTKAQVLNMIHQDEGQWLEYSKDRFETLNNQKETKLLLDKKLAKAILVCSTIVGIVPLSISIILESSILWTVGVSTLLIGSSFATASIISLKNIKEQEEIDNFKETYINIKKEYDNYEKDPVIENKHNHNKSISRSLSPSNQQKNIERYVKVRKEDNKVA